MTLSPSCELLGLPLPGLRAFSMEGNVARSVLFKIDDTRLGYIGKTTMGWYRMGIVRETSEGHNWFDAERYMADNLLQAFAIAQHLLQLYPPKEERADHP